MSSASTNATWSTQYVTDDGDDLQWSDDDETTTEDVQSGMAGPAVAADVGGCPPGLEHLTAVHKIIVEQLVEMREVFTGVECRNKYRICNALGQQVYFAAENSVAKRSFVMNILDNAGREVCRINAPEPISWFCEGRVADIEAPPGVKVGAIKKTHGGQDFHVCDHLDQPIYYITTPCDGNIEFPVTTLDSPMTLGVITKFKGALLKEMFTNPDVFGVDFPFNLDPRMKITLIGATFLINFMFFEDKNNEAGKAGGKKAGGKKHII